MSDLWHNLFGNSRDWTVDNDELESEVTVAWDALDTKLLDLLSRVLSKHLVGPQVPNLHELVGASHNTKVWQTELEVLVSMLAPVDDSGDGVAT